jgi:hypothetical protein
VRTAYRFASFAAVTAMLVAVPGSAQKTTGPKARYAMDVSTMSGMGMGAMMGGGLGGLLGGGGDNYMLDLRLTSTTPSPTQPEKGDHFFLPAAKMGKSVPLLGDAPGDSKPKYDYDPKQGNTGKAQGPHPDVLGLPCKRPQRSALHHRFRQNADCKNACKYARSRCSVIEAEANARDANAAWWPNGKNGKQPKSGSSLRGDHRIASGFTPEIKFSVANDYMAALNVNPSDSGGSILLGWNSIPTATGYAAWAMGGMERAGQGGDMVMWTSANNRDFSEGMGWLSPAEVQKAIAAKNVMPPSQTSCNIPAEAKTAAGGMMFGSMNAFGPEENFAFPPKPADPKAVWHIEWTSKVRFRAFCQLHDWNGQCRWWRRRRGTSAPQAQALQRPVWRTHSRDVLLICKARRLSA